MDADASEKGKKNEIHIPFPIVRQYCGLRGRRPAFRETHCKLKKRKINSLNYV